MKFICNVNYFKRLERKSMMFCGIFNCIQMNVASFVSVDSYFNYVLHFSFMICVSRHKMSFSVGNNILGTLTVLHGNMHRQAYDNLSEFRFHNWKTQLFMSEFVMQVMKC